MTEHQIEDTEIRPDGTEQVPEDIEKRLQGLSDEELLAVGSRARRIVYGRRNARRKENAEGGRWLLADRTNCHRCPRCKPSKEAHDRGEGELEKIHGPYWYLGTYVPANNVYTNARGRRVSGRNRVRYIGRRLPADLAEDFGLEEGATPEAAGYAE